MKINSHAPTWKQYKNRRWKCTKDFWERRDGFPREGKVWALYHGIRQSSLDMQGGNTTGGKQHEQRKSQLWRYMPHSGKRDEVRARTLAGQKARKGVYNHAVKSGHWQLLCYFFLVGLFLLYHPSNMASRYGGISFMYQKMKLLCSFPASVIP